MGKPANRVNESPSRAPRDRSRADQPAEPRSGQAKLNSCPSGSVT